jgi:hypothetical protein
LGGPQIADLQIEAMALALARSTAWTHFINLSDQDFPVKPRGEIVAQLAVHASTHVVDWFDPFATRLWPNIDQRLGRWHLPWPWLHRALASSGKLLGLADEGELGFMKSVEAQFEKIVVAKPKALASRR